MTLIASPDDEVYLSIVSVWEISIKYALGKLPLPVSPDFFIPAQRERHGIARLDLDEEAVFAAIRLPPVHRDPFDRMLVCQALVHGLTIVTPDRAIRDYPVRTAW